MRFNLQPIPQPIPVSDPQSFHRFNEISENLEQIQLELLARQAELRAQFKKDFSILAKNFFAAVPELRSITWTQYSPYRNDGDTCNFKVRDIFFGTDTNDDWESYRSISNEKDFAGYLFNLKEGFLTPEQIELCEKMQSLISNNEDLMEDMFGDHALVVVRPSGIQTREYKHN